MLKKIWCVGILVGLLLAGDTTFVPNTVEAVDDVDPWFNFHVNCDMVDNTTRYDTAAFDFIWAYLEVNNRGETSADKTANGTWTVRGATFDWWGEGGSGSVNGTDKTFDLKYYDGDDTYVSFVPFVNNHNILFTGRAESGLPGHRIEWSDITVPDGDTTVPDFLTVKEQLARFVPRIHQVVTDAAGYITRIDWKFVLPNAPDKAVSVPVNGQVRFIISNAAGERVFSGPRVAFAANSTPTGSQLVPSGTIKRADVNRLSFRWYEEGLGDGNDPYQWNFRFTSFSDLNSDGKPDMLFQEMNTKQLYAWYMNGVTRSGGAFPNPKTLSNNWKVVSTADFNADGKPDILLQEMSTKQLYVWYMNGVTRTGGAYLNPKTVSGAWRVAAVADFNADGKPDILMQEHNTKQVYVWFMDGKTRTGGTFLNPKTVSGNWKVVGAADMNGDYKTDIVLQEASTKQLYVWYMNGVNRTGGAYLNPKTLSNNWKVVAVRDMNADGKPDLVLQEFTTRQMYVWYMNGVNRTGGAFLTPQTIGGAWRAVGGNGAWVNVAAASSVATSAPDGDEENADGERTVEAATESKEASGCNSGAGLIAVLLVLPAVLAGIRRK